MVSTLQAAQEDSNNIQETRSWIANLYIDYNLSLQEQKDELSAFNREHEKNWQEHTERYFCLKSIPSSHCLHPIMIYLDEMH